MSAHSISIYTPSYNAYDILTEISYPNMSRHIFLDNASTDGTAALLMDQGHQVVENKENLGRLGNWTACMQHFLTQQESTWFKWLFMGDELVDSAHELMNRAIDHYPDKKMFVFSYNVHHSDGRLTRWQPFEDDRVLTAEECAHLVVQKGNIFGAPLSLMVHRDVLLAPHSFAGLPWAGDMHCAFDFSQLQGAVYIHEPIGVFNMRFRRYFLQQEQALKSQIEEYMVRETALRCASPSRQDHLKKILDAWFIGQVDQYAMKHDMRTGFLSKFLGGRGK